MRLRSGLTLAGLVLLLSACGFILRPSEPVPGGFCPVPVYEAPAVNACAGSERLSLAFVGDVLLGLGLQQHGYDHGFGPIWRQAVPLLSRADIAVANLEGQVAPDRTWLRGYLPNSGPVADGLVYTGFPFYNYHPVLLDALKAAGIDMVTTANNHAMDRGSAGAAATLDEVARRGIGATGSLRPGAARDFVHRRATRWGTLSFIACTFSTNGVPDPLDQVLLCYGDREELLETVQREASRPDNAGVIVLPHWGLENMHHLHRAQEQLARDLAAAGALAVIGTHPHAVQPWATARRGGGGDALIVYSTGNFISSMASLKAETGAMALVELCKAPGRRGLAVAEAGWVAMRTIKTRAGDPKLVIAPRGTAGAAGSANALVERIAPGWSAQPAASCAP